MDEKEKEAMAKMLKLFERVYAREIKPTEALVLFEDLANSID